MKSKIKATMKTFAALTFLVMFVASCGGAPPVTTQDTRSGTATHANTSAFEPPPAPGVKR
jgi:PBP1b-binding outer membrane lipoprotein LpoB